MHQIDIADDTFIRATPASVRTAVHDRGRWRAWWPDLILALIEDRGSKGIRWRVDGAVHGTMEIWLENVRHGVVVHYFLRADLADVAALATNAPTDAVSPRRLERVRGQRRIAFREQMWQLKDELEATDHAVATAPVVS